MEIEPIAPLPLPDSKEANAEVLISGAGPVGLLMACLLKQADIDVVLIDPHVLPGQGSKAAGTMPRSFEQMELAGVGAYICDLGRPMREARMSIGEGAWTGQITGFQSSIASRHCPRTVGQNVVETELSKRYKALGGRFYRGARFVSYSETPQGVSVKVKHEPYIRPPATLPPLSAAAKAVMETEIKAQYLLGCDGKQSAVRQAMGASYEGHDYKEVFLLADVEVPTEQAEKDGWEKGLNVIVDDANGAFVLLMRLQETRWRTYYCAKGLNRDCLSPEFIQQKWRELVPPPGPFTPTEFKDMAFFEVSCKLSSDYVKGRVYLSGDAAHCHSPAGGQGMNTGLQDAANLAWKVASVIKGHAPESLLSSYTKERKPIAEWVLNTSDKLFQGATTQVSRVVSVIRRRFLKIVLSLAPDGAIPPPFLFNRISGLGLAYRKEGTCKKVGAVQASYIQAGDRLPDVECLVVAPKGAGPRKIFTLQILCCPPHLALRLLLVADVSKDVVNRAEVEKVLHGFAATAKGVPIQPVLYTTSVRSSGGCFGCFAGVTAKAQESLAKPVEFDHEVLADFQEYCMLAYMHTEGNMKQPADIASLMGVGAGGRGLLVVRPDGYIAVSQLGSWESEPVLDALRQLNYIS